MLKKIEHTAVIVKELQQGIQFYTQILGFELRAEAQVGNTRKIAFLYLPSDPSHEVELIEELENINEALTDGAVDHIAFAVEDIENVIAYLKQHDIQFTSETWSMTATGSRTIYFKGAYRELLQLIEKWWTNSEKRLLFSLFFYTDEASI